MSGAAADLKPLQLASAQVVGGCWLTRVTQVRLKDGDTQELEGCRPAEQDHKSCINLHLHSALKMINVA